MKDGRGRLTKVQRGLERMSPQGTNFEWRDTPPEVKAQMQSIAQRALFPSTKKWEALQKYLNTPLPSAESLSRHQRCRIISRELNHADISERAYRNFLSRAKHFPEEVSNAELLSAVSAQHSQGKYVVATWRQRFEGSGR